MAERVTVTVPDPGAATTFEGENLAVKPVGNPVAVKVIAALKLELGVVVMVRVAAPAATLGAEVEGAIVNVGAGATTMESDFVCFSEPLVADTVAAYVPALALLVAVSFRTLFPEPGAAIVAGVNAPETPVGNPVTENATAALKVEFGVLVNVTVLEPPAATLTDVVPEVNANVGAASTVTEMVACCLVEPLVPATVAE